jgi:hypothetical protein
MCAGSPGEVVDTGLLNRRVFYCINKGMDSESDYMNDGTIARGGGFTRKIRSHEHRRHTYRKGGSLPEAPFEDDYNAIGGSPASIAAAQRAAAARAAAAQRAAAQRTAASQRAAAAAAAKAKTAAAAKARTDAAAAAAAKAKIAAAAAAKAKADAAAAATAKAKAEAKTKAEAAAAAKAKAAAAAKEADEDARSKCVQTGKEYISGKCLARCPQGQVRSGSTCKDDPNVQCPAGQKKDSRKGCVPNPLADCGPGQHHNGTQCVSGTPPACTGNKERVGASCVSKCSSSKERVGTSCITKCRPGLKRKLGTTQCEDDPDHECPAGEIKKPGKGCVNQSNGFSGLGLSSIIPAQGSIVGGVGAALLGVGGLYLLQRTNPLGINQMITSVNKIKMALNNFQAITDTPYGWLGAPVNPINPVDPGYQDDPGMI